MGEIADAYIWGEMNGIDMNDNPDAWVQYYKEIDEEEFTKTQIYWRMENESLYTAFNNRIVILFWCNNAYEK